MMRTDTEIMPGLQNEADSSLFVCRQGESVLAAMERCLDNGLGACFVLDDDQRLLGRIELEDLRCALVQGKLLAGHDLKGLLGELALRPSAEERRPDEAVTPLIDKDGRFKGVRLDRSRRFVQVARPDLSHGEFRLALDAFLSSWISSSGSYIRQFQDRFAALVGRRHGIAVSNGTCALHLALRALGIGPGDEVILPDLTFAATANAVLHCGATPVIVDVDPVTWGISPQTLAPALTPRTRALLPVHLYGRPAAMTPLIELARGRGLHVIEDCAEAIGARHAGRLVGSFGDVGCFSFFANKTITTGEGGMCLTDDEGLAERLCELRDHGMVKGRRYWHERVGFNYRMTNPQAAIGVAQLERIGGIFARNRRLEALYRAHLADLPGLSFPPPLADGDQAAVWLASVLVPPGQRARMIETALRAEIELRPFFHPLSEMPPYRAFARDCPVSRALSQSGLSLPTSNAVDAKVVDKLKNALWQVLGQEAA
jgi:perosamine synthetase